MEVARALSSKSDPDEMTAAVAMALDNRNLGRWWWLWFAEVYPLQIRPILQRSTLSTAAAL